MQLHGDYQANFCLPFTCNLESPYTVDLKGNDRRSGPPTIFSPRR